MNTENSSIHTKKYRQILSAVHMVYRLVNSTYNVKELTLRLTRLVSQFIKGETCAIYIFDKKTKRLKSKAIFDNRINIYVTQRKLLDKQSRVEKKLLGGFAVSQKHAIGLPLVSDETIGAILIERKHSEFPFGEFDRDMLAVMAEQSVTAIKNIQLYEDQQEVILGSIRLVGKLLEQQSPQVRDRQSPIYFKVVRSLAEKLKMGKDGLDRLYYASILRDAGALDIPYDILSKTSHLTPEEFKVIREQPARAVELIKPVEFLKPVLPIILYHHEKFDGTGYPSGLSGEQIPLGARILHVVDAFEAMTRERPYKRKLTDEGAMSELRTNSGSQFDPHIVNAFFALSKQKKFRKYLRSLHK